ncbi:thioredoxin reductase [Coleophoma cylindrospora]|uniref:Thioredoxin reductase n=1 Tax=Coleophoma cylindrospora TaxID=1849047 RepID=A0A3D8RA58_9HELO|nr:thioredoxin reductase [Coleophoma cylindrospora]
MAMLLLDAIIIGGGPAGLAAATGLARQLHTAVLFDSGLYRNRLTMHMHNVPTWDHQDPRKFREAARNDLLRRYESIKFEDQEVQTVNQTENGTFEVLDGAGRTWTSRKLVLATGVKDILPDIDGYEECWANGIYHCLFCHGYEDRGVPSAGVLAVEDIANVQRAMHLAGMARRLTEKVTIYTNGNEQLKQDLAQNAKVDGERIRVDSRRIVRFEKGTRNSEVLVHFEQPTQILTEGFLVHAPRTEPNGPFTKQLSLATLETGEIKTSHPLLETSVPGVFAIGDVATPLKSVTQALAMGSLAAAGVAFQVQAQSRI